MSTGDKLKVAAVDPGLAHFKISLVKSVLRMAGCVCLFAGAGLMWFGVLFLVAEILGILEEVL